MSRRPRRVGLLSSEPLRPRMAGIGVRYLEMARALSQTGLEVVIVDPGDEVIEVPGERRRFDPARVGDVFGDCDVVVAQGQLANDLLLAELELPVAVDLYDPWLIENFAYVETLGLDPYRNDHATWRLQLARGDFFLCSSEEQRLFYLGLLTALGRVHPQWPDTDPEYRRLIDVVPFGLPEELPPHRPRLSDDDGERPRLLFGGLYDWYDPWTLLDALARLEDRPWTLFFVANPNPEATPQALLSRVERWCRDRGWWGSRVRVLPWVPAESRWDLLRDVDALVAPASASLETTLSMRTRFLEALAVGCPVVMSSGGTVSRLVHDADAGWVVPPGDIEAMTEALVALLGGAERSARCRRGLDLARRFQWSSALAPLIAFCREPWCDDTKEAFAVCTETRAPADGLGFRLRRRARRWLGRGS